MSKKWFPILIITFVLMLLSGFLTLAFNFGFIGLVITTILGFAFLYTFRVWWVVWQKEEITERFKRNKIDAYIYVVVLGGLILLSIIFEIFKK